MQILLIWKLIRVNYDLRARRNGWVESVEMLEYCFFPFCSCSLDVACNFAFHFITNNFAQWDEFWWDIYTCHIHTYIYYYRNTLQLVWREKCTVYLSGALLIFHGCWFLSDGSQSQSTVSPDECRTDTAIWLQRNLKPNMSAWLHCTFLFLSGSPRLYMNGYPYLALRLLTFTECTTCSQTIRIGSNSAAVGLHAKNNLVELIA